MGRRALHARVSGPGALDAVGPIKPVTVKMATSVPTNSSWFLVLKDVADKWSKLSNGRVKVTLYGGGTKGDEPEVVAAMRLGENCRGGGDLGRHRGD